MLLTGEAEVLGKYPSQFHFVHHKSHPVDLGSNPDLRVDRPATSCLIQGTTLKTKINPNLI